MKNKKMVSKPLGKMLEVIVPGQKAKVYDPETKTWVEVCCTPVGYAVP